VGISQAGQWWRLPDTECGPRRGAQFGVGKHGSVIGEADQPRVEGGVPQRRKHQAVMDIEPLCLVAFGPGHDVGGSKQSGIGDTGDRAAGSPIIHQGGAEDVLADWLDDEPLDLRRLRQAGGLRAKPGERCVGETDSELVDAVERGVERGQRSEGESGEAGPGQGRTRNGRKLRRDTRVIDQGPRDNTPAIQISPRAVVEPKGVLLASRPRPPSYLTFRAGFRTEGIYPPMRSRPYVEATERAFGAGVD